MDSHSKTYRQTTFQWKSPSRGCSQHNKIEKCEEKEEKQQQEEGEEEEGKKRRRTVEKEENKNVGEKLKNGIMIWMMAMVVELETYRKIKFVRVENTSSSRLQISLEPRRL